MRITLTSIFVDNQRSALAFYTNILGFEKRQDIPVGDYSWLTVGSPEQPEGPELLLEPSEHPAVKPYRDALVSDGIPLTQFTVDDVEAEYRRLSAAGVAFVGPPSAEGTVMTAVFDDTCGNLIQLVSAGPDTTQELNS